MDWILQSEDKVARWIKKKKKTQLDNMIHTKHLNFQGTHGLKVKGWQKDIPCEWKPKESRGSYTHIRQNRL